MEVGVLLGEIVEIGSFGNVPGASEDNRCRVALENLFNDTKTDASVRA